MMPSDDEAIAFVRELVGTPSVSGDEAAAAALMASRASRWGMRSEIDAAGNAIAEVGGGTANSRLIVLLGHIDTVPGEIPVRIENGVLHGRGSVDAKGPLAAMLVAAARVRLRAGVRVVVAGAVGEETPHSPGARFLVPRLRPDACIIGEPSGSDGVTLGYKGRLVMRCTIRRDSAHSAGPEASAGDSAVELWGRVLSRVAELNAGRTGAFDVIQATLQAVNTRADGLSVHADLVGGFRLPVWMMPEALEEEIARVAVRSGDATCVYLSHERAVVSDRNDAVVRALSGAIRGQGGRPKPKLKTGTSDMNVVAPHWRCPIAAYGPGDSALDHTPREHLRLDEYLTAIRTIEGAIAALAEEWAATDAGPDVGEDLRSEIRGETPHDATLTGGAAGSAGSRDGRSIG